MFFDWFQKVGGQGEAIWASLPSSLPGGCDRRSRSATAYHVPDGILTFSGSEGENGGKKLWWEKMALVGEMCQEWYELPLLLRQGWCFHANAAPMHMVASWVTSRSVQKQVSVGSQRTKPWQLLMYRASSDPLNISSSLWFDLGETIHKTA